MEVTTTSEKLFFNTVKIATRSGDGTKSGTGTGFFYNHRVGDREIPFIVTNKHVVEGWHFGGFSFIPDAGGKPDLGKTLVHNLPNDQWSSMWVGHPDPQVDIAVCAFQPLLNEIVQKTGTGPFFAFSAQDQIPTDEQIAQMDAFEELVFVGYPNGVWDQFNLLPVMRRGTAASPLQVDFEGKPKFVIDASVFGGSSGSPVYLLDKGFHADRNGTIYASSRFFLLGVIAEVFTKTHHNEIISIPIPTSHKPVAVHHEGIDLGVVFKSRTITECCQQWVNTRLTKSPL
ncbi:trypsin-like peptidase domain-containing protein [Pseudomonas putida]|uniref:trypsin-like peptidase domain-containing protein n=1 Tax=Pseudomonas putida TaxID=303 RepID=UPI002B24F49B|nr:trypsin-like peptidase domain-containing protein [Pseudomonas putida]